VTSHPSHPLDPALHLSYLKVLSLILFWVLSFNNTFIHPFIVCIKPHSPAYIRNRLYWKKVSDFGWQAWRCISHFTSAASASAAAFKAHLCTNHARLLGHARAGENDRRRRYWNETLTSRDIANGLHDRTFPLLGHLPLQEITISDICLLVSVLGSREIG